MYTNFLKTQSADGSRNMGMNVIDAKDGDNTSFFFSVLKSYCFRTHRDCFFPIILSLNIPYEIVVHLSCFLCLPSFSSATFFPFEKKIEEKQTNTSMMEKKEKKSRMEPFFLPNVSDREWYIAMMERAKENRLKRSIDERKFDN